MKENIGKRILAIICMTVLLLSDMPANVWAADNDSSSSENQEILVEGDMRDWQPDEDDSEPEETDSQISEDSGAETESRAEDNSDADVDAQKNSKETKQNLIDLGEFERELEEELKKENRGEDDADSFGDPLIIEETELWPELVLGESKNATVTLNVKKLDIETGTEEAVSGDALVLKDETAYLVCEASSDQQISNVEFTWVSTNNLVEIENVSDTDNRSVAVTPRKGIFGGNDVLKVTARYTEADGVTVRETEAQVNLDVWPGHDVTTSTQVTYAVEKSGEAARTEVYDTLEAIVQIDGQEFANFGGTYAIQWQKQMDTMPGEYSSIERATEATFVPESRGEYRFCVTASENEESHQMGGIWYSEPIEVYPVEVSITLPPKEQDYGNSSEFLYSAEMVVTRTATGNVDETLKEAVAATLKLESSNAGSYVGILRRTDDLGNYQYRVYGEKNELYGTLTLAMSPNACVIQAISDLSLTINPVTIPIEIRAKDKNFDNTEALLEVPEIKWGETEIKKQLELVICEAGITRPISSDDFVYASSGNVDADTEVLVELANPEAQLQAAVENSAPGNFVVQADYGMSTIRRITMNAGDTLEVVGKYKDKNPENDEDRYWFSAGEDGTAKAEVKSKEGYQVSAELEGTFGEKAEVAIGEGNKAFVFVKNGKNEIAKVSVAGLHVDNAGPSVTRVETKTLIFNKEKVRETYSTSDVGTGVKSIYYLVSAEEDPKNVQFDPDSWTKVTDAVVESGKYTFEIERPKFGYVYICALDNVGNQKVDRYNMLVLENDAPLEAEFKFSTKKTKPLAAQEMTVKVSDDDTKGKAASGIQSVEYKLTDADGKDVTGDAKITVTLGDTLIESDNFVIRRKEEVENLEQVKKALSMSLGFTVDANGKLNGTYKLNVTATDYCGNSNSSAAELCLDGVAPKVFITKGDAVLHGEDYYYNGNNAGFTVTFEDENLAKDGTCSVEVQRVGSDKTISKKLKKVDASQGVLEFTEKQVKNLGDGIIKITVKAKDLAGNASVSLGVIRVTDSESDGIRVDGTTARFILDTKSPQIERIETVMRGDGKCAFDSPSGTVTYSVPFDTTVTIKDQGIDMEALTVKPGTILQQEDGKEETDKESEQSGSDVKPVVSSQKTDDGLLITYSVTKPGDYDEFELVGTDYAGNPITIKAGANKDKYDKWIKKTDDNGAVIGAIAEYRKAYENAFIKARISYYKQKEDENKKITEEALEERHRRKYSEKDVRDFYNSTAVVQVVFDNLSERALSKVSVRMAVDKLDSDSESDFNSNSNFNSAPDADYVSLDKLSPKTDASGFSLKRSEKEQTQYILRYLCEKNGEYRLFMKGENMSGEPMEVTEKDVTGVDKYDVKAKDITSKKEYGARDLVIVDLEAPILSAVKITTKNSTNKEINKEYGNRYYFNSDYEAEFTVSEKYLDTYAQTICIYRSLKGKVADTSDVTFDDLRQFVVKDASSADASSADAGSEGADSYTAKRIYLDSKMGMQFDAINAQVTFQDPIRRPGDVSTEGVYDYLFLGEDIAGNALVVREGLENIEKSVEIKESELLETYGQKLSNVKNGFLSNPIVIDTTAPVGKVEIQSGKPAELRYVQIGDATSLSLPYISDTKAVISVTDGNVDKKTGVAKSDVTPYRISYSANLKNGSDKKNIKKQLTKPSDKEFSTNNVLTYMVEGSQIFSISDVRLEDLAGNVSKEVPETHKIFLDPDAPVGEDIIAPSIALSPTVYTDKYGNQGQHLYDAKGVSFNVTVCDPYGRKMLGDNNEMDWSSSGLASVRYAVYSVGKLGAEDIKKQIEKGNYNKFTRLSEDEAPWVSEKLFPNPSDSQSQGDQYLDDLKDSFKTTNPIEIPDSVNRNDLMIMVTATDNAGNTKREYYLFGIDRTAPVITLSYDNQVAKNDKYFRSKNGRTATITVKDRNFDPGLIQVVKKSSEPDFSNEKEEVVADSEWRYKQGGATNGDDDTWECKVEFVKDGNYELHICDAEGKEDLIADRAGNTAKVNKDGQTAPNAFVIDKTAPEVTIRMGQTPDAEDRHYYYRADNCGIEILYSDHGFNLAAKGIAEDMELGVPKYSVSIDGREGKEYKPDGGDAVDTVILTYTAEEIAGKFEDGEHLVTVEAVDLAGNRAEAVVTQKTAENVSRGCEFDGLTGRFILDKTAPRVTAINTVCTKSEKLEEITDNYVYDDTKSVYYNQNIDVIWKVEDAYVKAADFDSGITKNGGDVVKSSVDKMDEGLRFTFGLSANNAYDRMFVSGRDKAGNLLVLDENYTHNQASKVDELQDFGNGKIAAVHGKVIDSVRPLIWIKYVSEDNANLYDGEDKNRVSAYYNKDITARYRIADNYELDGQKIWVGQANAVKGGKWSVSNPDIPSAEDDTSKDYRKVSYRMTGEGRYTFTAYGTDRALNPVRVREMRPRTDDNPTDTYERDVEARKGFVSKYILYLDKTNPRFTLDIKSPLSNNQEINEQGNRYYFNSGYTATLTITETNYDSRRISFVRGGVTAGSYNSETVIVDGYGDRITGTSKVFTDEVGYDGVFRYAIYGSDKAGNPLVAKSNASLDGKDNAAVNADEEKNRGSNERQADTSNHIVVDTVSPFGQINISNGQDTYYSMFTNGNVTFAEPYRQEQTANILFTVDTEIEKTPVRMAYEVTSTIEGFGQSGDTGDYVYGRSVSIDQNGMQQFKVASYVITDLAGNVTEVSSDNFIYLDVEPPTVDTLAPTISVVANAPGEVRSGQGQPLFNSDVPVNVVVTDPYGGIASSGLAEIQYDMYINGELVSGDTTMLHGPNTKFHDQSYEDEELDYQYDGTVVVDAGSHNYNDLRVVITAMDNSGNTSSAEYTFGIDVTSPTIAVSYDNNDALNGKYFKADRTATVVVTERNFDSSKINIQTESTALISGWSHSSGGSANGDDDTWTGTISYTVDGEYHLAISGTDLLGNAAPETQYNGVAPTDFVLDKTAPKITISYDNNDVRNEKYYKADRTATITVDDVNFDGTNNIVVKADEEKKAPAVAFEGKVSTLPFNKDGIYQITGTVTDMAGNVSEMIQDPEFVLDKTMPALSIEGVKDLSANPKPLNIVLKMLDTNVNEAGIRIDIKGTNNGDLEIGGKAKRITKGVQYTVDKITKDDYYTLVFTGTDLAGNEVVKKISFSENQNGTVFVFEQKEVEGKYTNKIFKPSFKLYNIDEVTILSVTLNGNEASYTYKDDRLELKDDLKSDGKYVITIDTKDAAGNVNSMDPVEFYIDRTKPVLTVVGVDPKQKYYFEEFDITLIHDNPLDTFEKIELDGRTLGKTAYVVNKDESVTIHMSDYGEHELVVTVQDAAGNTNEVEKYEFVLTKNPVIRWYSNKPLFFGSLAAASALVVGLIIFLWNRRKRSESE